MATNPGIDMPNFTGIEKRAWMLLQAAGMLINDEQRDTNEC